MKKPFSKGPFKSKVREEDTVEEEQQANEVEENKPKEYPVEAVQGAIPVKDIYRGMIVTADNRYVKIIEVFPINFALRSVEEQDNIIHLFASWLRISPIKLQFKVITRRADSSKIIGYVRSCSEGETQPKCRELAKDHIEFIKALSGREALTRRFFIIFEYEANMNRREKTIDEIAEIMNDTARKIRDGLRRCGNETLYMTSEDEEDYFQAEVLYEFYNRNSCVEEPLYKRVMRVTSDTMKVKGLREGQDSYPKIPVVDFISPRGIDFTHPDYFICDGSYSSIFLVANDGYPTAVPGGWMSQLIEAGEGIDVDIVLKKEDRVATRDKVATKLKLTKIKASGRSETDTDAEEITDAIQSAQYIKQSLSNGEDFFYMCTYITVSANTFEELEHRKENVVDYLYSRDITPMEIKWRLEDAFKVVAPMLNPCEELMHFAARNVMTSGAASVYPFTSCEICDENGIVLGVNRRYQSLVNIDIFNTKKYKNANIAILGTTGSGKTYTELTMALRMRIQGIQTFIISPDKSHEFRRACSHIGGSYIRISPGSSNCINIMEIRPVVNPIAEFLDESDASETDSWLAQKTSQLLTFFHIISPEMTNEEEQLVDDAIIKTYNMFGITHDNKSVYEPGTNKLKKMPLIENLQQVLTQKHETQRIANILARFVTGSVSNFNNYTNVDLNNKFIVFDLEDLQGTMKAVGMFIVMDYLWSRIKENRTERKAIFIDEGWQLIGASSDARAADFVYRIFKIIRGYGGSAIFATQDISDLFAFKDGKYGKAIISNSKIKIVLGLEPQEAKYVQDILQLTKNEVRSIVNFERGEGLICANNNKVPVYIRASTLEDELITTDPNQLRAIVKQKQEEAERARMMRPYSDEEPSTPEANHSPAEQKVNQNPPEKRKPIQNKHESSEKSIAPKDGEELMSDAPIQPQLDADAMMSILAMEQLSDSTISKAEAEKKYGKREIIDTVRLEDDAYEDPEAFDDISAGTVPTQQTQPEEIDKDLFEAPSISETQEEENDVSNIKMKPKGGRNVYGNRPPADF